VTSVAHTTVRRVTAITEHSVTVNGVDFAYLALGGQGPLALCMHGFPDSAHTWRHLLPSLAEAGYRAVAPFQRGYAPTAVPADGRYQTGMLAMDAIGFHDALGADADAVLIGHDWGAPTVYGAAVHAPKRWAKVVGMSVPPGPALAMSLIGNLAQLKRSWYMFFFQHGLADMIVPGENLAFIDMLWRDWSPGFDGDADVGRAKAALAAPANLTAALGYYRASIGDGLKDPALDDAQNAVQTTPGQPLLYLHGADDGCIGAEVAELCGSMAPPNVTVEVIEGCGHFLQLERPDVVNSRVVEFLA
jgi:pimeloyl-ACP methyl ester carboxylesterase